MVFDRSFYLFILINYILPVMSFIGEIINLSTSKIKNR